jgi:hypothetical protein
MDIQDMSDLILGTGGHSETIKVGKPDIAI